MATDDGLRDAVTRLVDDLSLRADHCEMIAAETYTSSRDKARLEGKEHALRFAGRSLLHLLDAHPSVSGG